MKISKDNARAIARKLTEKKQKEVDALDKQIRDFCQKLCEQKIPNPVYEIYKKHREYFENISFVQLIGNGANYESYSITEKLPSWTGYSTVKISLTEKQGDVYTPLANKSKILHKELSALIDEIASTLLALGSDKKIRAEFPEAAKYLPTRSTQALIVNVDSIREKLK